MDYETFELANGIRVVHRQTTNTKIAHCAIMLDIGSRDELPEEQGLAHFWEHMAFKGTSKRKAFHIINRLESLGGELNAYTTKEKICFYAAVLDQHLDKAVELLCDITFNSTFPEAQIEKERHVILEEMAMYRDTPEDAIQDQLDCLVFKDHQLGNNILGKPESVMNFQKKDFIKFLDRNIDTSKVILASVGAYSMKSLLRIAQKHMESIPFKSPSVTRSLPPIHEVQIFNEKKDLSQSHVGIGRRAYDIYSDNKVPFHLLNNIIGGHSMNSRLNMALRENNGFVYNIESNYHALTDTGFFTVFYATEPVNFDRSIRLVEKEFKKLREKQLGTKQLHSAKEQLKGQIAMANENNQNAMLRMAKNMLDHDKSEPIARYFDKIDLVSAKQLQELANEMLDISDMSMLTYTP